MSWAGWVFDFYDLILYTFLLIPIKKELSLPMWKFHLYLALRLLRQRLEVLYLDIYQINSAEKVYYNGQFLHTA
jgi:hypothetical protein